MSGRATGAILGGVQGRVVRAAIATLVAASRVEEPAISSQQVGCGGCGNALRFEPEATSGHVFEICDRCRTRRRVERRQPHEVPEPPPIVALPRVAPRVAASAPIAPVRHCEHCGSALAPWKRGRRGGRPPRLCKDRRACQRRAMALRGDPSESNVLSVRQQVLAAVPMDKGARLDAVQIHARLPEGTDLSSVRVALFELWGAALVTRERLGVSYRYWRTT